MTLQGLLYQIFVGEKKFRVDDTAAKAGISAATLYDYIEGRRKVPADFLIPLYSATRDIRFFEFFLKPFDLTCAPIPTGDEISARELESHLTRIAREVGHLAEKVVAATEDGVITRTEKDEIVTEIRHAHTELHHLSESLKAGPVQPLKVVDRQ